jgi:hypothetical protein
MTARIAKIHRTAAFGLSNNPFRRCAAIRHRGHQRAQYCVNRLRALEHLRHVGPAGPPPVRAGRARRNDSVWLWCNQSGIRAEVHWPVSPKRKTSTKKRKRRTTRSTAPFLFIRVSVSLRTEAKRSRRISPRDGAVWPKRARHGSATIPTHPIYSLGVRSHTLNRFESYNCVFFEIMHSLCPVPADPPADGCTLRHWFDTAGKTTGHGRRSKLFLAARIFRTLVKRCHDMKAIAAVERVSS